VLGVSVGSSVGGGHGRPALVLGEGQRRQQQTMRTARQRRAELPLQVVRSFFSLSAQLMVKQNTTYGQTLQSKL
jgi:hypothetical protein